MIAIVLASLALQQSAATDDFRNRQRVASEALTAHAQVEPADWSCADPLIARNYNQRIDARQLALRIADECTRPYRARSTNNDANRILEGMERTTYGYGVEVFQANIEGRIQQARRRDAIKLN